MYCKPTSARLHRSRKRFTFTPDKSIIKCTYVGVKLEGEYMKKLKTALLLVLVVAVLTGCTTFNNFKEAFFSDGGNNSDTIKIGVLEPQTGNDSQKGEMEIRGIQLANELVPEVLGKKIELVYADTQSSIYVAESAVSEEMPDFFSPLGINRCSMVTSPERA